MVWCTIPDTGDLQAHFPFSNFRLADQQAKKIKLTQEEHKKTIHAFRNNMAEHRYKLRGVEKATEEAKTILNTLRGKIHRAKVRLLCMTER